MSEAPVLTKVPFVRNSEESNFMASFDSDATDAVTHLNLEHVFGYRGYDARSNVDFYLPSSGPENRKLFKLSQN